MTVLRVVFLWDEVREEANVSMPISTPILLLEDGIKNRLEVEYQGDIKVLAITSVRPKLIKERKVA